MFHEQRPKPDPRQIVDACIETIKAEFLDRVPIVETCVVPGICPNDLNIWFVVETAAEEDAITSESYTAVQDRIRDVLLLSGYFRERPETVVWTRILSKERMEDWRNWYW